MDKFFSAWPNTNEGASQGAKSCKPYVSSRLAFQRTTSWGTQSHKAVVSSGFVCTRFFRYTMVTCDCVSRCTTPAAFSCALCGQKKIRMDTRVPISALLGRPY